MSALKTVISDIYEPTLWSKYFVEATTNKSALVQSGILASSPEIDDAVLQGGRKVEMPFWDDLPHDTDATTRSKVATEDDTDITPAGVTTDKDVAWKYFRTQDFQTAAIVKYANANNADPATMIIDRYAMWWVREIQRLLLKSLAGCFSNATIAANLSYDISGETATTDPAKLISSTAIENARFLLGDAFGKLTGIIMHSVPFARLRQLDLIDFVPVSSQDPLSGTKPMYMGLDVIVDDTMTKTPGATSGYKYDTFLFGRGAVAYKDIPLLSGDPEIEVWRDPKKGTGAGSVDIITRKYFILHPRGLSFTGTPAGISPSDAELEADNWTQVYQTKNIRIVRLRTN